MAAEWVINGKALEDLFESTSGPTAKLLKQVGTKCVAGAKRLCPVDTGRLRSSITEELRHDDEGLVEVVGTDVEYAAYVELGTHRARAQPFLRPAAEAAKP
jgi:HK97 gp10 family phage protein